LDEQPFVGVPFGSGDQKVGCSPTESAEKNMSATIAMTDHERCLLSVLHKDHFGLLASASNGDEKFMIFKAAKRVKQEAILMVQKNGFNKARLSEKRTVS